ncbi:hypothetical protein Dimus_002459 [Dionaea muscipula]
MRPPSSLIKEDHDHDQFLKEWVRSTRRMWAAGYSSCCGAGEMTTCSCCSCSCSLMERKKAIKLSADIAMASTRNGTTLWSRAVLLSANAASSSCDDQKPRLQQVIRRRRRRRRRRKKKMMTMMMMRCRKSSGSIRRSRKLCGGLEIAKRLVEKRTQVLRGLVPGGEYMDDESDLFKETLDYILSLRTQVHVMQSTLANATHQLNFEAKMN